MKVPGEMFIELMRADFRKQKALAEKAFGQISVEQFFVKPSAESNSVATIMRHLAGNMISRWTDFYTSDGEKPGRNRDAEFEDVMISKEELMAHWESGWTVFLAVLDAMKENDLIRIIYIRKEAHSVMQAVVRQHSHYSYHVGQIVQLCKMIRNSDFISLSIPKGGSELYNQTQQ